MNMTKTKILSVVLLLMLTSCSGKNKKDMNLTEKQLYERGMREMQTGEYKNATETFTKLENEHPAFAHYADTLVLKAYAFYSEDKYTDAILTIDDFIQQFPMHKDVAYMYYLKAMSNYNQIMDIGRDQEITLKAKEDFRILVQLYPNSKYASDAKWKLEYIDNILAGKEMEIGRFYMRTNKPIASINRFKDVIEKYQTSIFTPEALYRLTEVYFMLGINNEATKYAAVLGYNYPKSTWYLKSYDLLIKNGDKRKGSSLKQILQHF